MNTAIKLHINHHDLLVIQCRDCELAHETVRITSTQFAIKQRTGETAAEAKLPRACGDQVTTTRPPTSCSTDQSCSTGTGASTSLPSLDESGNYNDVSTDRDCLHSFILFRKKSRSYFISLCNLQRLCSVKRYLKVRM